MFTVERQWLIVWLFVWVGVMGLVVYSQWNRKLPSVGFPLCYLFNLSINHWFGAMIYSFPWYYPQSAYLLSVGCSPENTISGFQVSVLGVIGFGFGSVFLAPWLLRSFKPPWLREMPKQPNLKLPKTYIFLGLLFYFVIGPILSKIPSVAALTGSGFSLLSVGLCLACWKAWCMADNKAFLSWLLISCCIPFLSMVNAGFISFGVAAVLIVLIFVFTFYRPRWQVLIIGLLVMFLGLSVLVTYFRDRDIIRAQVWGGQSTESRIEQVWKTMTNFEFFNVYKQQHLEVIDGRLNMNIGVGLAINHISEGIAKFADGETLGQAVIAAVPRILWPNKPISAGSGDLVSRYTGLETPPGTSIGVGNVLEFYLNFGTFGVVFGFILFGTVLRVFDITAGQKLLSGNWVGFASWFLPGLGLMNPAGSLAEVVSSVSASAVLVYLINRFYLNKQKRL
ncbi:hypothetical protein PI95_003140 [Hassallia byssoidea VB512170]|uniref:Oligosaccharide repeat unit polymerase n=1 Tax=Hassallia byssoidea VB512170 TaxID=1304833 RepID=A0A846H3B6_9CYAN|nr:hypothetical protein [Hassalia byssoidea]NEU71603.1 hypothetical protein [Hassalia byssoidea VB512170]